MKSNEKKIRIKVMFRGMKHSNQEFIYEDACFIYDADCQDYDWLVVYDELPNTNCGTFRDGREKLKCPKEHTILLTVEPISIKRYSKAYTNQFGHLLTNRPKEAENHSHYHFGEGYFKWFYEKPFNTIRSQNLPKKTKTLSAVCSSKQMKHTQHASRFILIKSICEVIKECDWYGHGVKPLAKKSDALDDYKYSLAVENHIADGHWSEKIADVLLAETLPFYAGDPKLEQALPADSFIRIPIDNPDEAINIIRNAIDNNEYEKRLPAILKAKELLLTKYNFWAQILKVIKESKDDNIDSYEQTKPQYLINRHRLRRNPIIALSDGWHHLVSMWKTWH